MSRVRSAGEQVRRFIISHLEEHPNDIVRVTAEHFGCTRQAVHKHIQKLIAEGAVAEDGNRTRSKVYKLSPLATWDNVYHTEDHLAEDVVWREDIAPHLEMLPDNVKNIWHYGFTEMFNNVIDHSEATAVTVVLAKTAAWTKISIHDNGIGIFRKIKNALGLLDERHAVLELAKGKFTTDPDNHSGEGIFFSSRMFDRFIILSREVFFSHEFDEKEDWILEATKDSAGTYVEMTLNNHTSRTTKKVFDRFTSGEDYGFTKTVVPVRLMRYGDDNLISRSQAKRLIARFDRFKIVALDFSGIKNIGQAFADEVFRVFKSKHPEIEIMVRNASVDVRKMISRAVSQGN